MRSQRGLLLGLALCGVAVRAQAGWGEKLWNDNRAEVAVYDSECRVDGKPRAFRETLLISKEQLNPDSLNKVDSHMPHAIEVFKLNSVQSIEADNYPRHFEISVFVKADAINHVVKASVGSQDWTGNGFKILKASPDGVSATLWTYANNDGAGDKLTELTFGKDDYIEDQLPLSLRALPLKDGFEQKVRVWASLVISTGDPALSEAFISVAGPEDVRSHAGTLSCWIVTVKRAAGSDIYWFEKAEPHVLVKMETADGRKRLLYGRARWSYWDRRLPRPNILN